MITRRKLIVSAAALPFSLALPIRSQAMELTDNTLAAFIVGGRRSYETDDAIPPSAWTDAPIMFAEYWAYAFDTPEDAERAFTEIYETGQPTILSKIGTLPEFAALDTPVPPVGDASIGAVFSISEEYFGAEAYPLTLYWRSQNIVYCELAMSCAQDDMVRLSVEAAAMTSNVSFTGRKKDLLNTIPDLPALAPNLVVSPDADMTFRSSSDLVEKLTT